MEQMSLFECMYERFVIKKPIRLIELFAGYGSQALALKYLDANFEYWRICEWATKSIQAYNDLHIRDYTDYSKELTQKQVIECLATYGISMNYNNPMTYEQIKQKGEAWQRQTYNNIIATHNLVDVSKTTAKDLAIEDTKDYTYILTYSFLCQDLSLAGKCEGMTKGSGTRSGMLWQVERLLEECEELPQVLVMENVQQVIGGGNIKDFQAWELKLSSLGYKNYIKVMNAKDYCIPQNRIRCFMVSILGNYFFKFPMEFELKLRLKDILDNEVEEKYFLSDKMIRYISYTSTSKQLKENYDLKRLLIRENTIKGYNEAYEGDGIYINRPYQKRGVVQKGMIQTLKTSGQDVGIVTNQLRVRKLTPKEYWRLMGVKDSDFIKVSKNQSSNSLYHLAGDSIVTTCLMAIFGEMLEVDYKEKINKLIEEIKEKK